MAEVLLRTRFRTGPVGSVVVAVAEAFRQAAAVLLPPYPEVSPAVAGEEAFRSAAEVEFHR